MHFSVLLDGVAALLIFVGSLSASQTIAGKSAGFTAFTTVGVAPSVGTATVKIQDWLCANRRWLTPTAT
jgi:hypothetical protein